MIIINDLGCILYGLVGHMWTVEESRQFETMPDDQHTPVSKQQFPTFCPKSPTHLLL